MIAYTSQLAHIVSSSYIKSPTLEKRYGFSAGSFKDMTRVAKLNENMWADLFLANEDAIVSGSVIYNDGEAIDEQFLNSVFRPYEKGSKGQFGLGMSIVKKTIDFFGMNLSVRNEEGGGVSFIINKL